jgi:DNA-directed RNA polymerase specialized sigma24 family protein
MASIDEFAADPSPEGSIDALVDRLEPLDRLVLVLHHVDGWSVRDVASAIGKSASATESLLVRARRAAREVAERQGHRD